MGLDAIVLGVDGASDVIVMTTGGVIAIDTVANFLVGSTTPDNLNVDLSDLNALVGDMQLAGDGTRNLAVDLTPTVTVVSAAYDLGTVTSSDILALSSATAFTTTSLATALNGSGSLELTVNGDWIAGDGFLVAYDDNTNSYLAYVTTTSAVVDNANFTDVVVTNLIQLTGVTDASLFLTDNIDIIA